MTLRDKSLVSGKLVEFDSVNLIAKITQENNVIVEISLSDIKSFSYI